VEAGLRLLFNRQKTEKKLGLLPSFDCGEILVDISDRDALYDAMDDLSLHGHVRKQR
jgi:hypothetical protein